VIGHLLIQGAETVAAFAASFTITMCVLGAVHRWWYR
jgi:hypothetical protein